ncbi:hypothetical protein CEUSTIGMA_g11173.t1 [Chlamydomonas eustigma]|uniref:Cytochrome c oxidase assembly protein CtaG/Cox11 n=1 Tax=Chlamydomonas eustigma TaxID=1157962 RepID=A0A250XKZ2_9CHLO|nr:hypothetical protein CEUSTIGMA_g11173.t1 [Chlamydomonas eustigma]|eukprot:GAX83748.1 hypothetical protein CEUSTIGMA_g11173.t1 [Chlamydomonas eustigma]
MNQQSRFCSSSASFRKPKSQATAAELGLYWGAAAVGMIGFSYATVPLYKIFCAATGYGGTVSGVETVEVKMKRRAEHPNEKVERAAEQREITVWFNSDVAQDMPWEFAPTQQNVRVRPGQSTLVFFTAKNKTDKPITGYSVYNVTPDKAAVYFNKIQCFCFEEQRLRGHEEVDMPVFFYLDPEMASDWNCRNIDDITLSYMFHRVADEDLEEEDLDDNAPTLIKLHGPGIPPSTLTANSQLRVTSLSPAA